MQLSTETINSCREIYRHEHAKFLTKSMLLADDLGKEFKFEDRTFKVEGQWINEDAAIDIIICDENKNYYKASHREVSHMMGYFRYRNPLTGNEYPEDHSKKRLKPLTKTETNA